MTDQAVESTQQESALQTPQAQEVSQSNFSIPEAYRDRGWAKDIKSPDDLWKLTDNAQSLIGKRPAGIPTADAPQEEWDKFYQAVGRPSAPSEYKLTDEFEGLPEGVKLDEYKSKAQELAHKIGLSPKQAEDLWNGYMNMELESVKGLQEQALQREAELDKEFDQLSSTLFGDSFKDVSEQAQRYLGEVLPDELRDVPAALADNPKALLALIKIANHSQTEIRNVKKKYGAEDKLASGSQASAVSQQEILQKMNDAKTKYTQAPVFSPERQSLNAEIESLRRQLQAIAK